MLHHIDRLKKIEESLHGTKSVSAQRDPSEERQGLN
jgi:hypothetical protein